MGHAFSQLVWQAVSTVFGQALTLHTISGVRLVHGVFIEHPLVMDLESGSRVISENPRATIPLAAQEGLEPGDFLTVAERRYEIIAISPDPTQEVAHCELHATTA